MYTDLTTPHGGREFFERSLVQVHQNQVNEEENNGGSEPFNKKKKRKDYKKETVITIK